MTTQPPPPVPGDDRDWTFVITEGCAECRFQPLDREDLADWFSAQSTLWRDVLTRPAVGERPSPQVWSPLEYGRHVQDMLAVLAERLEAMRSLDTPMLADWDGDAKAVELEYWNADPMQTLSELQGSAVHVGRILRSVSGEDWERAGLRSDGMSFTVTTMSQYIAHEMQHHLHDAGA